MEEREAAQERQKNERASEDTNRRLQEQALSMPSPRSETVVMFTT